MRQQLIQYVDLLFAAAPGAEEIKQEILHNTLDRYDDLISQGKSPEAAYRLAISGIGDINEILGQDSYGHRNTSSAQEPAQCSQQQRNYRGIAIAMYILSPTPLFILSELGLSTMGLCLTLGLIAAATYVMVTVKREAEGTSPVAEYSCQPELSSHILRKQKIAKLLGLVCVIVYLLVSFLTGAWYITWIIFPIFACVRGLIHAILDLKEKGNHET